MVELKFLVCKNQRKTKFKLNFVLFTYGLPLLISFNELFLCETTVTIPVDSLYQFYRIEYKC